MEKTIVDDAFQRLVTLTERLRFRRFAQYAGYLFQLQVDLAHTAVVHQVDRLLILHIHTDALGCCPVAEIPPTVFLVGPFLEQSVNGVFVYILEPMLHPRVVVEQHLTIAIVHVGTPRSLHYETAPIGTSACLTIGRSGVGQRPVVVHHVAPSHHPVIVESLHIEERLHGLCGSIAVAAVAQSLNVGTVHHITVESEVLQRVGHHIVDAVQVIV